MSRVVYRDGVLLSSVDSAPLIVRAMFTPTVFLLLGGFSMSTALNKYEIDLKVRHAAGCCAAARG